MIYDTFLDEIKKFKMENHSTLKIYDTTMKNINEELLEVSLHFNGKNYNVRYV